MKISYSVNTDKMGSFLSARSDLILQGLSLFTQHLLIPTFPALTPAWQAPQTVAAQERVSERPRGLRLAE